MNFILVVGAGTMGHGIAQVFAQGGCSVRLVDVDLKILRRARRQIAANVEVMVEAGAMPASEVEPTRQRVETSMDLAACARDVDLAIECVPEQVEIKREIFDQLDRSCPQHAILASNTSTLNIFDLVKIRRPESLCIVHWYAPPHIIPLVDVVKSPSMPEETCSEVIDLLRRLGKTPIALQKFVPGYLVNRLQLTMAREINYLLDNGYATPDQLDVSVQASLAPRMMVLGLARRMDFTGLDVSRAIQQAAAEQPLPSPTYRTLENLVQSGQLGVKTGKGFYDYSQTTEEEVLRERDLALLEIFKTKCDNPASKQNDE